MRSYSIRVSMLVLFLIVEKKLLACHHYDVSCVLVRYGLHYVEVRFFLILNLLRAFIMKGCLTFSNSCFASVEIIIWFLHFILLMWCVTFINLYMLSYPYISGLNLTWSWCIILSICFWIRFDSILLTIFTPIFIRDISLQLLSL